MVRLAKTVDNTDRLRVSKLNSVDDEDEDETPDEVPVGDDDKWHV